MNNLLRLPPPAIALILAVAAFGLDQFLPFASALLSPILGAVMVSSGFVLIGLAYVEFQRAGTTPMPTGTPSQFVRSGPYHWTRNPMYLGLCTVLTGAALFLGGLPLFIAPVIFLIIMDKVFIPHEEARMSDLFGYVYQEYRAVVKRWF